MQVRSNGIIEVHNDAELPPPNFRNDAFKNHNYTFIAPFYADVYAGGDTACNDGTVKYNVTYNDFDIDRAKWEIQKAFPEYNNFTPEYLILATWYRVGYHDKNIDKVSEILLSTNYGSMTSS